MIEGEKRNFPNVVSNIIVEFVAALSRQELTDAQLRVTYSQNKQFTREFCAFGETRLLYSCVEVEISLALTAYLLLSSDK
jgi:hypothetical protein